MKLLCWNINGLRANLGKTPGQSFAGFLDACDADVLCFQETKLTRAEMTSELACPPGYDAFYSFAKHKKGYSGVATLVRHGRLATVGAETSACPFHEGRIVLTEHPTFVLINVYCPAHGGHLERKLAFHEFLLGYVATTKAAHLDKPLIFVGDLNVIHKPLDDCGAYEPSKVTAWLDTLLATHDLMDAFRQLHPTREKAYTCWRALTGARETNYGVRLDYILCDRRLVTTKKLTSCDVWQEKEGSDHCPVLATLSLEAPLSHDVAPTTVPSCAKFYPEFAGKQTSMHRFLGGSRPPTPPPTTKKTTTGWQQQTFRAFLTTAPQTSEATSAPESVESIETLTAYKAVAQSWKMLLPGKPPPPPLCTGHREPSLLRTVLKRNDNYGRKFFICAKPEGAPGDVKGRCNFFQWHGDVKKPSPVAVTGSSDAKRFKATPPDAT